MLALASKTLLRPALRAATFQRLCVRTAMFNPFDKDSHVNTLLLAKDASKKTYDEIANEVGLTNTYTAMLFHGQAQLKPHTEKALRAAVPALTDEDVAEMKKCPFRSFDRSILDEPLIYRTTEAVQHYGLAIKAVVNEKFGDGIMSAIDFYVTTDKIKGKHGEDRVVITLNGKFLPHVEQRTEDMTHKVENKL